MQVATTLFCYAIQNWIKSKYIEINWVITPPTM